jgi:hypothetical protein
MIPCGGAGGVNAGRFVDPIDVVLVVGLAVGLVSGPPIQSGRWARGMFFSDLELASPSIMEASLGGSTLTRQNSDLNFPMSIARKASFAQSSDHSLRIRPASSS